MLQFIVAQPFVVRGIIILVWVEKINSSAIESSSN